MDARLEEINGMRTPLLPYSWDLDRWTDHRDGCAQCAHSAYVFSDPCPVGQQFLDDMHHAIDTTKEEAQWN